MFNTRFSSSFCLFHSVVAYYFVNVRPFPSRFGHWFSNQPVSIGNPSLFLCIIIFYSRTRVYVLYTSCQFLANEIKLTNKKFWFINCKYLESITNLRKLFLISMNDTAWTLRSGILSFCWSVHYAWIMSISTKTIIRYWLESWWIRNGRRSWGFASGRTWAC